MSKYKVFELKECKNGNIHLTYKDSEVDYPNNIDDFYNDVLNMSDYTIDQINGYPYLTNCRTQLVYDLSCHIDISYNILEQLEQLIINNGKLILYSLSKKESKSLLQDMENGY